jgi:hypothetical protein
MERLGARAKEKLLIVASVMLLCACATTEGGTEGGSRASMHDEEIGTFDIRVSGTPAQLSEFHRVLRHEQDTRPLKCSLNEGNVDCDRLKPADFTQEVHSIQYLYYETHPGLFEKLGFAFKRAEEQSEKNANSFTPNQKMSSSQTLPIMTISPGPASTASCQRPCVSSSVCNWYYGVLCVKPSTNCTPCNN